MPLYFFHEDNLPIITDSYDAKVGADQDILVCVMISFLCLNVSSSRANP